jgi:hypothetical protein
LIDTHVHIDELVDLKGAVRRAQSAGIRGIKILIDERIEALKKTKEKTRGKRVSKIEVGD